jgi:hypothetical protein
VTDIELPKSRESVLEVEDGAAKPCCGPMFWRGNIVSAPITEDDPPPNCGDENSGDKISPLPPLVGPNRPERSGVEKPPAPPDALSKLKSVALAPDISNPGILVSGNPLFVIWLLPEVIPPNLESD